MNDDKNINLPLRVDVLLRLTVYSEITSYVRLNSGLAGRKTFVIFSVPKDMPCTARAGKFFATLITCLNRSIDFNSHGFSEQ